MVIHNEIFDTYRLEQKEINKSLQLLIKNKYTIFDQDGNRVYEKEKTVQKSTRQITKAKRNKL